MTKISAYTPVAIPKLQLEIPVTDPTVTGTFSTGQPGRITVGSLLGGLGPTGTDDTSNIQGMLTLTGSCPLGAGTFLISQTLTFSSNTKLMGLGRGITTLKAAGSFAASQVGSNAGMNMLMTLANGSTRQSKIAIQDLTLDMNEANVNFPLPGYATNFLSSPANFFGVDGLTIRNVEIINSVGYAIWANNCTTVRVEDCTITAGLTSLHSWNQKDCIHVSDCTGVVIADNILTTGTNGGDDPIAIQGISTGCTDVTISDNVILASGAHGITLNLGGAGITGVTITGNEIHNTQNEAILLGFQTWNATSITSDVTIDANVCRNVALANTSSGITVQDATNVTGGGHTGAAGWAGVTITNNVLEGFTNTAGFGIYVMTGDGIAITGNIIRNWKAVRGIVIGDRISATSITVKNYNVSNNVVDLSTTTATGVYGIALVDSPDGVCANNKVTGPGVSPGTAGIWVLAIGTALTGLACGINRITGFATGILEANGGAAPNFNTFTGNNTHGCTTAVTTVGANDVSSGNL